MLEDVSCAHSQIRVRQSDPEDRPVGFVGKSGKRPAMGLDDRAANGEPNSRSTGLGRKERFEDAVLVLTLDSRSGIFNGDHDTG